MQTIADFHYKRTLADCKLRFQDNPSLPYGGMFMQINDVLKELNLQKKPQKVIIGGYTYEVASDRVTEKGPRGEWTFRETKNAN